MNSYNYVPVTDLVFYASQCNRNDRICKENGISVKSNKILSNILSLMHLWCSVATMSVDENYHFSLGLSSSIYSERNLFILNTKMTSRKERSKFMQKKSFHFAPPLMCRLQKQTASRQRKASRKKMQSYWWQCTRSMKYHCPCWLTTCFLLNELIRFFVVRLLLLAFYFIVRRFMLPIMCLRCALFLQLAMPIECATACLRRVLGTY